MKYAIIKIVNGNFSVVSEGITSLENAKTQYHGICQTLWNAKDVYAGCVFIIDENGIYLDGCREYIRHNVEETE